ncbi:hypothetical protein TrCOL_g8093 [Triparma columacea]|uniref:Uncharacterized protein n=1 Tax=Triparma columacea TaxID=722753 RepID=A0A9W7GE80_9STRA|nr:hypothetical protein TrCOL_g8093 [Triparma columacea]
MSSYGKMLSLEEKANVLRTQLGLEADFPSDVVIGVAIAHHLDHGSTRAHLGVRSRAQREITEEDAKAFFLEIPAKSWTYEEHNPRPNPALKAQCLESMADACIARLIVSGGGEDKSLAKEQAQEAGADGLPKPRIYVTEMVGGWPWVYGNRPFPPFLARTNYGCAAPSLIEYPTIPELEAMSTEQLQALRFTKIGWKVRGPPGAFAGSGWGLDALKFWRNDGEVSPFYGASKKLNYTDANDGDASKSFKTAAINGEVRGVKVFYTHEIVIGLALLGEGGQVLAQEGPGKARDDYGEYYHHAFLFGANEKLVGFKFYSDSSTPRLGCILADMGTPQEGGVIDPALVPSYLPNIVPPIAVIHANVQPDSCMGMGELWRFSEAAKPHNMPTALREHMTEEDYVAIMDGVNAVLDRYGAPKETDCFCQFPCRQICIDGPGCGILNILGLLMMPLIFPVVLMEMEGAKKAKKIKEELKAALAAFEAKGLAAKFGTGTLLQGQYNGTHSGASKQGSASYIVVSLPRGTGTSNPNGTTAVAPQPMVMGERAARA